ncbi:DUF2189 domain-containing protein [Thalassococcus sp. S3]|uniref:DUF2189 domain-containing protein n=1 Tax=Thalassococcus sp. S3 TaxID=2017482 RepID=UPI0010248D64|nr:DUF2189 domain-containing protein [Thalassococcus sp. S3]QBF33870.1 hypothetical protein CFI11_22030 [Thalassococcus sp. S3]
MVKTIGNPLSWAAQALTKTSQHVGEGTGEMRSDHRTRIEVRDLTLQDLKSALQKGVEDFMALRTDVMFIVLIYPIVGLMLTAFALNRELLPLLFPVVAGFALLGPVAAIGLYEMSRRREHGLSTGWSDAFSVMGSPSFVPMLVLGFYLAMLFVFWMLTAYALYILTLGPEPPISALSLLRDVFTTSEGWVMLVAGLGIGFVFAVAVLAISIVSFPLLIDRHVGIPKAVGTSIRLAQQNPRAVAAWGAVVVVLLGLGIGTLFMGLIFVLPVLGHATWHLYRRAVVPTSP